MCKSALPEMNSLSLGHSSSQCCHRTYKSAESVDGSSLQLAPEDSSRLPTPKEEPHEQPRPLAESVMAKEEPNKWIVDNLVELLRLYLMMDTLVDHLNRHLASLGVSDDSRNAARAVRSEIISRKFLQKIAQLSISNQSNPRASPHVTRKQSLLRPPPLDTSMTADPGPFTIWQSPSPEKPTKSEADESCMPGRDSPRPLDPAKLRLKFNYKPLRERMIVTDESGMKHNDQENEAPEPDEFMTIMTRVRYSDEATTATTPEVSTQAEQASASEPSLPASSEPTSKSSEEPRKDDKVSDR